LHKKYTNFWKKVRELGPQETCGLRVVRDSFVTEIIGTKY